MKRTQFKRKAYQWKQTPLKRTAFKKGATIGLKRTPLARKSKSEATALRDEIQAILRQLGLIRDGGCVLRHYPEAGDCGGYRKDGELILQAEHLHTRSNNATFAEMKNIVILCKRHHFFFKPQYGMLYWILIRKHIGEARWNWLESARQDKRPYKIDFKLIKLGLEQDLRNAEKN